jgi:hypothetical protein
MILTLHPPQVRSLATYHTPTSTTDLLSLSTLSTAVILAILLVAPRTSMIAGDTAPSLVAEGTGLSIDGETSNEADTSHRHYDDRDYDSENGSRYRRRSRYD